MTRMIATALPLFWVPSVVMPSALQKGPIPFSMRSLRLKRSQNCKEKLQLILEHALLQIRSGRSQEFEAALLQALPLIAAAPGFLGIEVMPCVETPDQYLLLASWENLEDHTEGFRKSEPYKEWKRLLHHFYEPFPSATHFGLPVVRQGVLRSEDRI
jgi:heme-degrading monooxygenase HmoA